MGAILRLGNTLRADEPLPGVLQQVAEGVTAIEYALLVAGVAVTLFAAFNGVTTSIGTVLQKAKTELDNSVKP